MADITPTTRVERAISDPESITPATRLEKFIANISGAEYELTPATRIEKLLDAAGDAAGSGEWSTEGIANNSEPNGDIIIDNIYIEKYALAYKPITSITAPTVTDIGQYGLYYCSNLTDVYFPSLTAVHDHTFEYTGLSTLELNSLIQTGINSFANNTALTSVKLPSLQYIGGSQGASSKIGIFKGCTSLNMVIAPLLKVLQGHDFDGCINLTILDFPSLVMMRAYCFNLSGLETLILRNNSVCSMAAVNCFAGTPFSSSGTGGTLYVPSNLITSYESNANWNTILSYTNNSIQAIEGSQYENYYADGTPVT